MKYWTVIFLLVLAACSPSSEKVVVGVSIPDTGFASTMGTYVKQGIDLALENLPEEDRNKFVLVYEDDQCNGVKGNSVARKLIHANDISYVIGPFCSAVINPTKEVYEDANVLRLITGLGIDSFSRVGDFQIILLGDVKQLMVPLAQYAYDQGDRRIGVIYQFDDYGQENADHFTKEFERLGGKIVASEAFPPKDQDIREQLNKVISADVDAVFVGAFSAPLLRSLQQIKEIGFSGAVYSLRNAEDTELIKTGGDALEEVIFPSLTSDEKTGLEDQYAATYQKKHMAPHEVVSANAHDSILLMVDAINACGKDTKCAMHYIQSLDAFSGASGMIKIDEHGLGVRSVVIKQVQNGDFVVVKD